MSTFTLFSALEKLNDCENDRNNIENKRIVIPDYFIKLLLQNKTRILNEQINKKKINELLINRHFNNQNYFETKYPNFYLSHQKYKSLEKNNYELENNKYNSALPKILEKRTLLNLRYKQDPRNYDRYKNLGKELINIQSKNNKSNIQTESFIPNKSININKMYNLSNNKNSKENSNENKKINNNK